jgi:hypothetical protein
VFCVAFLSTLLGERALAEIEPYEARITIPRALVLSGPGEKFYPTGTLSPGDIVEVYRDEEGGWLGIRPPKGSFSLVSEKELTTRDGDLAEISEDEVSSRIGSQLSDKRNAVQVRLKLGEVVQIIGKESIDGETWCKIEPPAGEFRWIHAASVERRGPISVGSPVADAEQEVVPLSATSESVGKSKEVSPADSIRAAEAPAGNDDKWRASATPMAPTTPVPPPEVVPPPLAPIASSSAPTSAPAGAATTPPSNTNSGAPAAAAAPAPTEFDLPRQLTDIELRLSRMASAPPQLWNTERLQRDAEQLMAQTKSDAERDAVKATMGKIDRFTVLARRYQQGGQAVSRQPSAVNPLGAGAVAGATADGRYDAVGVLRPVVSKRPGAPQFALVDERGQVVTFVTPTPDVNLQPYLGKRVGIAGNRGFIPEFNRAHVTAGRVTPLMR